MRVWTPTLLALAGFAGWVWLTGPGTSVPIAIMGALVAAGVFFGSSRLLNGPTGEAETGDDPLPGYPPDRPAPLDPSAPPPPFE